VVNPSPADTTPPQVLWTVPANNQANVNVFVSPSLTDSLGAAYSPNLLVQFSETMSATTVTTGTIQLLDSQNRPVPITVAYDGVTNQAIVVPRAGLLPGSVYAVTVSTGVTDLAGNPMAASYTWTIRTRPVTLADIQSVAGIWHTRRGDPGYDLSYDLDRDGVISIRDIMGLTGKWTGTP
jgi:hypothetical protein